MCEGSGDQAVQAFCALHGSRCRRTCRHTSPGWDDLRGKRAKSYEPHLLGVQEERMMGLEPTTFCMASLSGRQSRLVATQWWHIPPEVSSFRSVTDCQGESWRVTIYS